MTDRIDDIDAQQRRNTANIADLITLSENVLAAAQATATNTKRNAAAIERNTVSAAESDSRFNILIQEMRADRRASQQAFQSLLLQLAAINNRVDDIEQANS